jgi:hypothetical protein
MNRRDLSLSQETHAIDFAVECEWLHCYGYRLFDLTWQLVFSVWVTTWPSQGCELTTRRNPTDALRLRLDGAGLHTTFYGDEFVQSLVGRVPTVDLSKLMGIMKLVAVGTPDEYSTPIVLLD